MATRRHNEPTDENRDAITGEPGAHPVGAGLGAAAGIAAGAVAGPIGAAVGAVVGGVAGGLAGKGIAEQIDPTREDAYWRDEYPKRGYYEADVAYDDYAPAYRYGWESRARWPGKSFDEAEPTLQQEWDAKKTDIDMKWERARHASRDAWDRIEQQEKR